MEVERLIEVWYKAAKEEALDNFFHSNRLNFFTKPENCALNSLRRWNMKELRRAYSSQLTRYWRTQRCLLIDDRTINKELLAIIRDYKIPFLSLKDPIEKEISKIESFSEILLAIKREIDWDCICLFGFSVNLTVSYRLLKSC